ncbi:PGF-CTERM-anchored ABC transporter substrate-binding protein [Halococcus saccharolyticus]|uniref:ABC transporter periplasmic protein n=1 Tax=Halococcus saccharolyticus DSM 5350 TaxID=1227455 RepID=M0MS38_9EURY|nr:PGF-CTERM-anchored ABC transporter substrate-binding protein [Halococcus saccharolyticus]EMA47549.1 ABC transporter periplasmic protein [Halococcus saccharolyticus DSM 5350]
MRTDVFSMILAAVVLLSAVGPAAATTSAATAGTTTERIGGPTAPDVQQATCSFPTTATDATGTEITVEDEPESVVTLSPSAAQTMWEIGAREKVVGLTKYASYLEGAETRTNVSGAGQQYANVEAVVGLEPDLVLAPNVIPNETVESLRSAGLTVFKFGFAGSIEDVSEKTRLTGELVGACEGANRIADTMDSHVESIRNAVANESRPQTLYLLGGGYVAGNNTFIGSMIETAGGTNLAANASIEGYKQISDEVIAQRDPEWLVVSSPTAIPNGTPWADTTAIQENQTIVVNNSYVNQPAPRVMLPLMEMARQLHPDAIEGANLTDSAIGPANLTAANATAAATDGGNTTATDSNETIDGNETAAGATDGTTMTESTADGTTGDTTSTETGDATTEEATATADDAGAATTGDSGNATTTSSGSGPGFGPAVAVIAVLAGTLLVVGRNGR